MATSKNSPAQGGIAIAHGDIRAASSIIQYVVKAERERGNTDLADTLTAADEQLSHGLEALEAVMTAIRETQS